MDLRPKLAREFATAAYKVFEAAATANGPDDTIEEATKAILELFVSHSLDHRRELDRLTKLR